ncbi:MAG: energy-coupling factor transporter ATPase [Clostridia bacterium]|nr:energy-coupling factor transporter ATPase [Clostridia bacterium]
MQIIATNLNYTYSEKSKALAVKAIKDINLNINEGDFFGIVGHTGSGKSTFIQHLNGLIKLEKDHGSLVVGEFNLADKKCDYLSLRAKVGMVFQHPEYQLFAETVFDDIAFGVKNFYKNAKSEEIESLVRTAMEYVGLDFNKYKDKSPFALSGGQKRRVAIAGVIAVKPEVLVLDEPVAGLDPQGKKEFLALLHELKKNVVKTIVIVSHDMNIIAENCNRVAVFNDGKIYVQGTVKEVFALGEELQEIGLDLPITARIALALKHKGITVENDFTVSGFASAVSSALFGKGGAK